MKGWDPHAPLEGFYIPPIIAFGNYNSNISTKPDGFILWMLQYKGRPLSCSQGGLWVCIWSTSKISQSHYLVNILISRVVELAFWKFWHSWSTLFKILTSLIGPFWKLFQHCHWTPNAFISWCSDIKVGPTFYFKRAPMPFPPSPFGKVFKCGTMSSSGPIYRYKKWVLPYTIKYFSNKCLSKPLGSSLITR